ncbi:MAG: LuxR C-terminal-related transcriptional regulator [Chloroflexota bacterium]
MHAYQAVVRHRSRRERRTLHTVALDAGVLAPQPAVTQVVNGSSVDAPGSDRRKLADASAPTALQSGPLTRRQFEIAELIAQGYSNDQIAEKLVLTPGTVGNHIGNILRRLDVRNRAQVAVWVTQQPVLSPSDH